MARDDLRSAQPSRAVTAHVGDRSRRNVEDVASGLQSAGQVDVLVPELEVLVPTADRRERLSPDERDRRPAAGRRRSSRSRSAPREDACDRRALRRADVNVGNGCGRYSVWVAPSSGSTSRPAAATAPACRSSAPTSSRSGSSSTSTSSLRKSTRAGRSTRGAPVVRGRQALLPLEGHELRARDSGPDGIGGPVSRRVVDDHDALDGRRGQPIETAKHHLARVPGHDDDVDGKATTRPARSFS